MIKYKVGDVVTCVREWLFPDGSVGVNINVGSKPIDVNVPRVTVSIRFGYQIDARGKQLTMSDQIIGLMMTMDALRHQYPCAEYVLQMPYIPYARQDRRCTDGEAFSIRVLGGIINSLDFKMVCTLDPHSTVADACIHRMVSDTQYDVFKLIPNLSKTYIVAPDKGASKKCEDFAKKVNALGVITCHKARDMSNGNIEELKVLDNVPEYANLLVLDDLCDGGATFIKVANALEEYEPAKLDLAVTHGLFTAGVSKVKHHYDTIYTTDSYTRSIDDTLTVFKV